MCQLLFEDSLATRSNSEHMFIHVHDRMWISVTQVWQSSWFVISSNSCRILNKYSLSVELFLRSSSKWKLMMTFNWRHRPRARLHSSSSYHQLQISNCVHAQNECLFRNLTVCTCTKFQSTLKTSKTRAEHILKSIEYVKFHIAWLSLTRKVYRWLTTV